MTEQRTKGFSGLVAVAKELDLIDTWTLQGTTIRFTHGSTSYTLDRDLAPEFLRVMIGSSMAYVNNETVEAP